MLQSQPVGEPTTIAAWAPLLGAVATFVAAGIALFKDSILNWIYCPRLEPTLETRHPFCVTASTTVGLTGPDGRLVKTIWQGPSHYVRLTITNRGNRRAEAVEVFLVDAQIIHRDGAPEKLEGFEAGNLKWVGEPRGITHSLNPHMRRHCDLGTIFDPSCTTLVKYPDIPEGTATFDLSYAIGGDRHRLRAPNKHELSLLISAANAGPVAYKVIVDFDGTWDDNIDTLCRRHLAVSIERR